MMYLETLRGWLIFIRKWLGDCLCPSSVALYGKSILPPPITGVQVLGGNIVDVIRELNMVVRNLMPNPISQGKVGGR